MGVPDPTLYELAAMWMHGQRYASSGLSAVDFYKTLTSYEKGLVQRMAQELIAAATDTQIADIRREANRRVLSVSLARPTRPSPARPSRTHRKTPA